MAIADVYQSQNVFVFNKGFQTADMKISQMVSDKGHLTISARSAQPGMHGMKNAGVAHQGRLKCSVLPGTTPSSLRLELSRGSIF
jgi:hypothetical protein